VTPKSAVRSAILATAWLLVLVLLTFTFFCALCQLWCDWYDWQDDAVGTMCNVYYGTPRLSSAKIADIWRFAAKTAKFPGMTELIPKRDTGSPYCHQRPRSSLPPWETQTHRHWHGNWKHFTRNVIYGHRIFLIPSIWLAHLKTVLFCAIYIKTLIIFRLLQSNCSTYPFLHSFWLNLLYFLLLVTCARLTLLG